MSNNKPLLTLNGVSREFTNVPSSTPVLNAVDLDVGEGETLAIVGPSGCGKSTLLNLIGGLDQPNSGSIAFQGRDIAKLSEHDLAAYRNAAVGFVFQLHHLLPQCSVLENVLVPTLVHGNPEGARERAIALLDRVGLRDRIDYRPGLLSGGERQRVAVVRALINKPRLLLADEPTGSLSPAAALDLAKLILELSAEESMAMIVVTHSEAVAAMMGTVHELRGGVLRPHTGAVA